MPLRTPLYSWHAAAGARLIEFGGWEMPLQYPAGILEEHLATRKAAGLFDVSHMGELEVRGGDTLGFVQQVVTNDVADVVEAIASHRPYRPALGIDVAIDEIRKNRDTLYDGLVVDACLRLFANGDIEQYLSAKS